MAQLTKWALAETLKKLMKEKPMAKISVSEISQQCNVSRKTFYYHFKDKYDLVNWVYYTELVAELERDSTVDDADALERICRYFYANKSFYCNALQVEGQNSFSRYFIQVLEPVIQHYFENIIEEDQNREFFATYFADAFRSAVTRWLIEDSKLPPQEFIRLIRLAMTGIAQKVSQAEKKG